jgi:hypothetical protein
MSEVLEMRSAAAQKPRATTGHGEKLTRKANAAIAALLSHATLADAAASVGISETTLWRWMQRDDFRRRLRQAQETVFDGALKNLQGSTTEAVKLSGTQSELQKTFGAGSGC